MGACIGINPIAKDGNRIKDRIDGAERADVFAKWPINEDGSKNRHDENGDFPRIQPSQGPVESLVQQHKRNAPFQRSYRTYELAKIWCSLSQYVHNKQRHQNDEYNQYNVLQLAKNPVAAEAFDLLGKWNLVEEILNQTERA